MAHYKIVSRWDLDNVLFEGEADALKDLVGAAVMRGAYLQGAYLRGADLRGAYLQGAYLRGADLRRADLRGAYLRGAYLRGAYLQGAYLRGADLRRADLRGAYLRGAYLQGAYLRGAYLQGAYLEKFKIKSAAVFNGLYDYIVIPFVTESDEKRIVIGCYNRSLEEWQSDFWNNNSEFPNNGSEKSRARWFAFEVAQKWLAEFVVAEKIDTAKEAELNPLA